jgi:hypothetical protein
MCLGYGSVNSCRWISLNIPFKARVAAGAFGFLTLIHVLDGPGLYDALSFFETIPSKPSLQTV